MLEDVEVSRSLMKRMKSTGEITCTNSARIQIKIQNISN